MLPTRLSGSAGHVTIAFTSAVPQFHTDAAGNRRRDGCDEGCSGLVYGGGLREGGHVPRKHAFVNEGLSRQPERHLIGRPLGKAGIWSPVWFQSCLRGVTDHAGEQD